MVVIQFIPKNWYVPIEALVEDMETLRSMAERQNGTQQESLWSSYESVCQEFLDHLRHNFGSVQGFSDFLQSDLADKMEKAGRPAHAIRNDPSWGIDDLNNYMTAHQASGNYIVKYRTIVEGLDYNRSFGRNNPPDLTP